jgi:hypothetical protein
MSEGDDADVERPWLGAAAALFGVGWGANQFAPLLLVYRAVQHVDTATAQAIFGVYALGLIPGLALGGPLSDRHGRRAIVRAAVLCSALASLVLMAGVFGIAPLFAGRLLAGAASGAAFSAGTAWVKELSAPPFADTADGSGALRAALAMTAGFGIGPLVAGLIAQAGRYPEVLPYAPHLLIVAIVLPRLWSLPESAPDRVRAPSAWRAALVPSAGHPRFVRAVLPMAPWVFAAPTVGFALLPSIVGDHARGTTPGLSGALAALTGLAAFAIQPLARRFGGIRAAIYGLWAIAAGIVGGAVAFAEQRPALVLVAAVMLGAGGGACFVAGLIEVQRIAPQRDLGGLTALYLAATYTGFAAPYALAALAGAATYPVLLSGLAILAAVSSGVVARASALHPLSAREVAGGLACGRGMGGESRARPSAPGAGGGARWQTGGGDTSCRSHRRARIHFGKQRGDDMRTAGGMTKDDPKTREGDDRMRKNELVTQVIRRSMRSGSGRTAIVLLALLAWLGSALPTAAAVTWSTPAEIVASSVISSGDNSQTAVAVQAGSGTPYAAWVSQVPNDTTASHHNLRLAKFTSGAWSEMLPPLSGDLVGAGFGHPTDDYVFYAKGLSAAVDSAGNVHVAFAFLDNSAGAGDQPRGIGYAKYDATAASWTTVEAVQTFDRSNYPSGNIASPNYPTIGLDAANPPHPLVLFEFDDANNNHEVIRFASRATGTWATTDVDTFCRGTVSPTMAIDGSGHAHVAYEQGACTTPPTNVVYRNNVSGTFSAATVVSAGSGTNQGAFPTIAIDPSGNVDITYAEMDSGKLQLATNAGGSFATTTLEAPGGSLQDIPYSFQINSANNKLILYSNGSDLKSATQVGTNAWSLDTVAPGAGTTSFGNGVINNANQMTVGYDRPSPHAAFFSQASLSTPAVAPTVTTPTATGITTNAATLGGNVTDDGGATITARGVVVSVNSTNPNPTIGGAGVTNLTATGTTGVFTVNASSLASGATYAYRAYATNSVGTTYTTAATFTTTTAVASIDRVGTTPTNAASVSWTVTFTAAVGGVTSGDVTLDNSGLAGAPAITSVTPVGGSSPATQWAVAASTGTGSGTLGLDLTGDGGMDHTISNLPFTGQVYGVDHVAPVVVSVNRQTPSGATTNATSLIYRVTFSKPVSGVDTGDFTLTTTGGAAGTIATVSAGSGTTIDVTVTPVSGDGTLRLDVNGSGTGIVDGVGNALAGGFTPGQTYALDHTAPAVSAIARAGTSPTNGATVSWTVTFSEPVSGVAGGNFALAPGGGLGGSPAVGAVTPSGAAPTDTWTVSASGYSGAGTLRLDMANSTGVGDPAGNAVGNVPFTTGESYMLDLVAPTVASIDRSDPSPTAAASVAWTVTFSKPVGGLGAGDFALISGGGLAGSPAVTAVTAQGAAPTATWAVTASTGSGSGTLRLDMTSGAGVSDGVGNAVAGLPFTTGQPYTLDRAPASISATAGDNQSAAAGMAFPTLQATVKNSNNQVLEGVSITFTVNPVSGAGAAFPGNATTAAATTDASGVATAPALTAGTTAGNYTVTANLTTGPLHMPATFHLTNRAGAARSLVVTTSSTNVVAGTAMDVTVKVIDTNGNTVTGYTGTMQFSSSDPQAVLPSDYTFTGSDGGVHTFTGAVTLKTAGAGQFVKATDSGDPTVTGQQSGITVTAGAAASIVPEAGTTPQSAQANTAFATALAVTVKEALTNPLPGAGVVFTGPATGAGGTFACPAGGCPSGTTVAPDGKSATVQTDATGLATAPTLTANAATGSYDVTANLAVRPLGTPATFMLTNTHGPVTQIAVTGIAIGGPAKVGEVLQLAAIATFADGTTQDVTSQVVWTSSDTAIATVDSGGKVTFTARGSVTITATRGAMTKSVTVTVSPPVLIGVAPAPAPASRPGSAGTDPPPTDTPSGPAPSPAPAPRTGR